MAALSIGQADVSLPPIADIGGTWKHRQMISLFALLAATQSAAHPTVALRGTAWIFSTIGHSEFCPAGDVALDLQTGQYALTKRAPRSICGRPDTQRPVASGRLAGDDLARVRAAFLKATKEGLEKSPEPAPKGFQQIIITNGGTPTLVIKTGMGTRSAPDEINRWSGAATELHDILDAEFKVRSWR